jgi:glycosyltransferase involved in cell wall biosynthesis
MIRILLTINNLSTAGMKYVLGDLAMGLPEDQFKIAIGVNHKKNSLLEQKLRKKFPIYEYNLRIPRRPWYKFPIILLKMIFKLKNNFDIVHSFDYSSDWTEGLAVRLAGIKWVVEKTNLIYDKRKWYWKLSLASHIVCLSTAQRDQLKAYKEKISVIPTGINIKKFAEADPLPRKNFGSETNHLVLACIAHLLPVKGHRELLMAMKESTSIYPCLKLLIVGEGSKEYEMELIKLQHQLGLENAVQFLGSRNDVERILKMADGKILATRNTGRREGFGAAIVEAMTAGLPVIATASGGPSDIIVPGVTGWLVDPEGIASLTEAIIDFCSNPQKRLSHGINAQNIAVKEYKKELMAQRYENIYFKNKKPDKNTYYTKKSNFQTIT